MDLKIIGIRFNEYTKAKLRYQKTVKQTLDNIILTQGECLGDIPVKRPCCNTPGKITISLVSEETNVYTASYKPLKQYKTGSRYGHGTHLCTFRTYDEMVTFLSEFLGIEIRTYGLYDPTSENERWFTDTIDTRKELK